MFLDKPEPRNVKKPRLTPRKPINQLEPSFLDGLSSAFSKLVEKVIGPPQEIEGRREAIRKIALITSGVIVAGTPVGMAMISRDRSEAIESIIKSLSRDQKIENLKPGEMVPEDERSANNVMIGLIPGYEIGGYSENDFQEIYSSLLRGLVAGTNVHMVLPEGAGEDFLELAEEDNEHLKFTAFELPRSSDGINYVQDVVSASGSKDGGGRFRFVGSTLEKMEYLKGAEEMEKIANKRINFEPQTSRLLRWIANEDADNKGNLGLRLFGDEWLTDKYPENFKMNFVPVMTRMGDMKITRTPEGKAAAIIGKENLARMIRILAAQPEFEGRGFNELLDTVKELYGKALGVEVIILDEENLRKFAPKNLKWVVPEREFFHMDMVTNTATTAGGSIAFCTDREEDTYLARVQKQMEELGFKVVKLPCGKKASMNYANSVIFTNEGVKTVYLPQYGIEEDELAKKVYEENGIKVIPIDMSHLQKLDEDGSAGSLHCRLSVLD